MASSALLKEIQAGKKLKKAETNDRSAPMVDTSKPSSTSIRQPSASVPPTAGVGGAGPAQLAGLFAGGMPKLKPTNHNSFAKPALGKPPSISKRESPSTAPSAPHSPARPAPTPPKPAPAAPSLPSRAAPSIPARNVPSVPAPPRRPAPAHEPSPASTPARVAPAIPSRAVPAIPSRPSLPLPARSASPAQFSASSRPAPAIPPRSSIHASIVTNRSVSATPGRPPPPPPPPRPSSAGSPGNSDIKAAPSLPARKEAIGPPVIPARTRTVSAIDPPMRNTPPAQPAVRSSLVPSTAANGIAASIAKKSVPSATANTDGIKTTTRKVPSPPPTAGPHRFPVSDFPPPRDFVAQKRVYSSGRTLGSNFDLGSL